MVKYELSTYNSNSPVNGFRSLANSGHQGVRGSNHKANSFESLSKITGILSCKNSIEVDADVVVIIV